MHVYDNVTDLKITNVPVKHNVNPCVRLNTKISYTTRGNGSEVANKYNLNHDTNTNTFRGFTYFTLHFELDILDLLNYSQNLYGINSKISSLVPQLRDFRVSSSNSHLI